MTLTLDLSPQLERFHNRVVGQVHGAVAAPVALRVRRRAGRWLRLA